MVESLPVGYRTVFNLFAIEGYSHQEIADLLGITESTSKSQLNRARNTLKEKIASQNITKKTING
jgi:RNA polymerase sigma-70 factor (ECF subfamily)